MNYKEDILGRDYNQYSNLRKKAINKGNLDLSEFKTFSPTILLPLSIFLKENEEIKIISPVDSEISFFLKSLTKNELSSVKLKNKNIISLSPKENLADKILETLISNHKKHLGGQDASAYFIGELLDNIYEHSHFSIADIMIKKDDVKKITDFCIIDNGISIPGSYKAVGLLFNDITALKEAILKGNSTKSEERGYGLRTTLKLLVIGLDAHCLIISGKAGVIINKESTYFFTIEKENNFNGTLISARIPYMLNKVNIYDYIE